MTSSKGTRRSQRAACSFGTRSCAREGRNRAGPVALPCSVVAKEHSSAEWTRNRRHFFSSPSEWNKRNTPPRQSAVSFRGGFSANCHLPFSSDSLICPPPPIRLSLSSSPSPADRRSLSQDFPPSRAGVASCLRDAAGASLIRTTTSEQILRNCAIFLAGRCTFRTAASGSRTRAEDEEIASSRRKVSMERNKRKGRNIRLNRVSISDMIFAFRLKRVAENKRKIIIPL